MLSMSFKAGEHSLAKARNNALQNCNHLIASLLDQRVLDSWRLKLFAFYFFGRQQTQIVMNNCKSLQCKTKKTLGTLQLVCLRQNPFGDKSCILWGPITIFHRPWSITTGWNRPSMMPSRPCQRWRTTLPARPTNLMCAFGGGGASYWQFIEAFIVHVMKCR